jgi:glutamate 5-kinase
MEKSSVTDNAADRSARMGKVKRLVVKIGSRIVAGGTNQLDHQVLQRLADDVVALKKRGLDVAIVTSGAVAAGMGRLGLSQRPTAIAELQAVAAVGQNLLMSTYESLFKSHDVAVGQVLLTAEDILEDRQRYLNLRNTFRQLFAYGAVPVINENDSVAVAELKRTFGENDALAAYVANLIRAELLVIFSDIDGLYRSYGPDGPDGDVISIVDETMDLNKLVITHRTSGVGCGGMQTKVKAARLLMACGEMTVIAHGNHHRLLDILDGQPLGTLFEPSRKRLGSRKRWIGFASPCNGTLIVDSGAERAITKSGRSLLPAGVLDRQGSFAVGDVVRVENIHSAEVARGLTRYASDEIDRVRGKSSPDVERLLGRPALEVIHRDDLVLI